MKNLYQACGNKVTVNLSVAYSVKDLDAAIQFIANSPASEATYTALHVLVATQKAVEKVLNEANGVNDEIEHPQFGPDCRPFANVR